MEPSFVLDASGVIRSTLDFSSGGYAIPSSVRRELQAEPARTAVEEGIRNRDIKIVEPSREGLQKASKAAEETGDINTLSPADLDVLAVALENNLTVISDDYAVQNTAAKLGLKVQATTHKGIEKQLMWKWACSGCGREMKAQGECPICGHKAKKKQS
jgi:UPF0271 protein